MVVNDDKAIKINGILLVGIIKNIEVKGSAIVEEIEIEGKGKKPVQAVGYADCSIMIEIVLYDTIKGNTKEEKLKSLQNIFKKSGQRLPNIYEIVNKHINSREIYKVIIKDFSTKISSGTEKINVSLSLIEYSEIKVKVNKKN